MVLLSGALRLGCCTVQARSWPEYKDDNKCTELRTINQPSPRSSITDTEVTLLLLLCFQRCQVIAAAGATLSTEQFASVYSSPSSHLEPECKVMFGGAALGKNNTEVSVWI